MAPPESAPKLRTNQLCRVNGLKGWAGRGAVGPILWGEFDTPEVRAWREEFDANSRSLIGSVSQVDDSAFLLFLGDRIDQDEFGA